MTDEELCDVVTKIFSAVVVEAAQAKTAALALGESFDAEKHPATKWLRMIIVEAYDTEEEARAGHDKWLRAVLNDTLPAVIEDCCNNPAMSKPLHEIADKADLLLFNAANDMHDMVERIDGGALKINRAARARALAEALRSVEAARSVVRSFMTEKRREETNA